jgi:hypothetical protein
LARLLAQPAGAGRKHWHLECLRPDPTLMKEPAAPADGPPTQTIDVGASQPMPVRIVFQPIE